MKTTHRYYSEESGDFKRLCHFISSNHDQIRTYSAWCLGRVVDWKYGLYENKTAIPGFCDKNAHLWFDGFGDLAGFAISENGDAGFAILTLEGYRFLFEEMLHWVLENWDGRGGRFSTEITEHQTLEAQALERAGFHHSSNFFARRFDLTQTQIPQPVLEEGFTIVDMATHPDYLAQRILRDDAFSGRRDLSEAVLRRELAFYNYGQAGPIYHPEADLCVMAPDGRLVSGCEGLIDARNATADIERICTHSEFRRRGFARAVIVACMARLRDMGMRTAYIAGYSPEAIALYGSIGHVSETKFYVYEL